MKFLAKSTKTSCVVASVLTGLLLITLIMLSTLLSISSVSKVTMTFIYTVCLVLILLIWHGILQIKVFNDYKSKRNYLCADGILSLCMGALLIVSGILLATLQLDQLRAEEGILIGSSDIRIFLTCFLAIIAFWKLAVMIISIKEKHFNWWCEMLFMIFWLVLAALCLTSMFVKGQILTNIIWTIVGFSWVLIVLTIFYMLYSYVIKTPNYLETEEAIQLKQEEIEETKLRKEKLRNKIEVKSTTGSGLQDKLKKLKELRDNQLITEEEYQDKKAELLERF